MLPEVQEFLVWLESIGYHLPRIKFFADYSGEISYSTNTNRDKYLLGFCNLEQLKDEMDKFRKNLGEK